MNKLFNGYYQNVRGLRTKSQTFFSRVALSDFDFISLTETWLTSDFNDREYFDNRYTVFRCDRSLAESGAGRGGGVAVAVRAEYLPQLRDWPVPARAHCDCVWVSIPLDVRNQEHNFSSNRSESRCLNICCIYLPHGPGYRDALNYFMDSAGDIVTNRPNDIFLITGDFNIPGAVWLDSDIQITPSSHFALQVVSDFLAFTGLKQNNFVSNVNNRILDLVFCSSSCVVVACDSPLVTEDVHHKSLLIDLNFGHQPPLKSRPHFCYNFHLANYDEINDKLTKIDWIVFFSNLNTESSASKFYSFINNLIELHVPRRKLWSSSKIPAWYSKSLKKVLNKKRKYHSLWKRYRNPLDYESYKILRKIESECYNSSCKK